MLNRRLLEQILGVFMRRNQMSALSGFKTSPIRSSAIPMVNPSGNTAGMADDGTKQLQRLLVELRKLRA